MRPTRFVGRLLRFFARALGLDGLGTTVILSSLDDPTVTQQVIFRLTYILTLTATGVVLFTYAIGTLRSFRLVLLMATIMLVFTAAEQRWLRRRRVPPWLPGVHKVIGLSILAVVLAYDGGVQSPLALLFILPVAVDGMLRGWRHSLGTVTLSTAYLAASTLATRAGIIPFARPLWPAEAAREFFISYVGTYGFVAGVTTSIGAWARRRNGELLASARRLEETYWGTIRALGAAIETRDSYTREHSGRVEKSAAAVAETLGLTSEEIQQVRIASVLHDIGKIGIPNHILNKPGPLTPPEWDIVRQHPVNGAKILAQIPGLQEAARMVRYHHERLDGSGYPDGRAGEAIPLGSRIIAVCDAYEAMTSTRPYRPALPHEEAVAQLRRQAGRQFDPKVVDLFVALLEWEGSEKAFRELQRQSAPPAAAVVHAGSLAGPAKHGARLADELLRDPEPQ